MNKEIIPHLFVVMVLSIIANWNGWGQKFRHITRAYYYEIIWTL